MGEVALVSTVGGSGDGNDCAEATAPEAITKTTTAPWTVLFGINGPLKLHFIDKTWSRGTSGRSTGQFRECHSRQKSAQCVCVRPLRLELSRQSAATFRVVPLSVNSNVCHPTARAFH